jgi:hypothetical protein
VLGILLGFPDTSLVFSGGKREKGIRKGKMWLLMHGLNSLPAIYVQVSYSSILSTVWHHSTESFLLLFVILFLRNRVAGSLTVANIEYSMYAVVC